MSDSFVTQLTIAHEAPVYFSRQEYCTGLSFPSPGDLPYPRIEPTSPALQVVSLPLSHQGSPGLLLLCWKEWSEETALPFYLVLYSFNFEVDINILLKKVCYPYKIPILHRTSQCLWMCYPEEELYLEFIIKILQNIVRVTNLWIFEEYFYLQKWINWNLWIPE